MTQTKRSSGEAEVEELVEFVASHTGGEVVANGDKRVESALRILVARERYQKSEKGLASRAKAQAKQAAKKKVERAALAAFRTGDIEGAQALLAQQ